MISLAIVVVLSTSTGAYFIKAIRQGGILTWLTFFLLVIAVCVYMTLAIQDITLKQRTISRLAKRIYVPNSTTDSSMKQ